MPDNNSWTVVVIDDEEDIRDVMAMMLKDSGYLVKTASDGIAGVDLCNKILPQIVITDIRMPGMDGIKVLETLKINIPDTEVIVATAFGEMDIAIRALQLDASDFITKPIGHDAFFTALTRAKDRYTARKKLKDIQHQDKMMSLGRLAASVAHEINNPLSGVLNYIKLMHKTLAKGALSEESRIKFISQLELIESELGRCTQIVSGLLTFSRKSDPAFIKINIENLLNHCVLLSRHKMELGKIDLKLYTSPYLPEVKGDFNQLHQCIINLLFNAVDAMPDGGTLELSAENDPDKGFVAISVKDTGHGISEKNLAHIFEPFFTTKRNGYGIGLGLPTVYGIIKRHKGSIDVKSRPDKGSVFTLRLPSDSKLPES
ncbi:MAG: response regulator [Proteobacteria bacterium]|nr:response regulator [Pseudomonadota bacterium]